MRYVRLPRLFEQLRIARGDGSYLRLMKAWAKIELLILDDWGLEPPSASEAKDLLEILDDRYETRSTLITSQLPIDHWHTYLGSNPTVADAILDRLLHNAHKILPGMIVLLTTSDCSPILHFVARLDLVGSTGRRARTNGDTGSEAHGPLTSGPVVFAHGPRVRKLI